MTNNIEVLRGLAEVVADIRAHCNPPNPDSEDDVSATYALGWADRIEAALAAMGGQEEAAELLRGMGLDPERFRTEGGRLNPAKVRAAIRHPESYAGLYLPREHDFGHSAKFGGEICSLCGAAKGTTRAGQPCAARPAPQQPEARVGGEWEPQPVTGGEFCLICDMPSGEMAYCSTCASVSIGEAWVNRPGQSKTTPPPSAVPEAAMKGLQQQAQELGMGYPDARLIPVSAGLLESAMQLLYMASNGRANIFSHTADEFRDLLAAAPEPGEG